MSQKAERAVKRALDAALAGVLLMASSPVLVCACVAVILDDGPPVLFHQRRAGRFGREFEVVKLRTMRRHQRAPEDLGQVREDHELVLRTGRVLRRLKIDELPQLLNVLRGDMSLVGPRPTLPSQVREYDGYQRRRLEARPGITGWAQINGNTQLTWAERITLDVWYVDHWSLGLDLRIMTRTVGVVLRGERPGPAALREAQEHENSARGSRSQHADRT